MRRALLTLALIALQLAATRQVSARPPDQVKFSPVPPLQEPKRNGQASPARRGVSFGNGKGLDFPFNRSNSRRSSNFKPIPKKPTERVDAPTASEAAAEQTSDQDLDQQGLWESDAMVMAREAVIEFCRRSAQCTVEEGEEFLNKLSELPPDEMQNWLERFQKRQLRFRREAEAGQLSRRFSVENSYRRREERQQTTDRIAELRGQALAARSRPEIELTIGVGYTGHLSLYYGPSYNPFLPIFDPSSPQGYVARAAAAASLPGDLPRDDPRNFLTGDEGFVTGDEPILFDGASPAALASPVLAPAPIPAA